MKGCGFPCCTILYKYIIYPCLLPYLARFCTSSGRNLPVGTSRIPPKKRSGSVQNSAMARSSGLSRRSVGSDRNRGPFLVGRNCRVNQINWFYPIMGSLGHISDLRWIFWAPNRREHTISASVPSSEIEPNKHFWSAEKARKTAGAEYSLLVCYTVLLESLYKSLCLEGCLEVLEVPKVIMQWLHVRQSCMGSLSQRDTKTDVFAEFLIFSNRVSAQQIEVITCQKYNIRGAPAI